MPTARIVIYLDAEIVKQIDRWVREKRYPNRSKAIETAVQERMTHRHKIRLIEETAKLNSKEEKVLAEEGLKDFQNPRE